MVDPVLVRKLPLVQEAILVLLVLLEEFQLKTCEGYKLEPVCIGIVQQHPKNGIPMTIEPYLD
jgi:hypothetical protein